MVALSRVLNRVQLVETLSREQRQSLVEQIGSSDSTIFQNLDVFAFADKLRDAGAILDDSQIDAVAEHIRSEMLRLGVLSENVLSSTPVVPQQVQFPTSLKLETDKSPSQLSLAELVKKLAENPSDLELKNELLSRPIVVKVTSAVGTRFAFKTESKFDAEKVLRFLNHLTSGKPAPRKFEDSFPISLDAALGISNLVWFNPLLRGQKLFDGLDYDNDQNWNDVPQQIREAVLWARFSQHTNFPKGDIDIWTEFERISSGTGRWKNVIEDYQQFIAEDNAPVALKFVDGIEEFVGIVQEENPPKKSDEGANTFGKLGNQSAQDAVRACAEESIRIRHYNKSVRQKIVSNLQIDSYNVDLDAIVLDRCVINSYNVQGKVYTPIGLNVEENSYGIEVEQIQMSWADLLTLCQQWRGALRG